MVDLSVIIVVSAGQNGVRHYFSDSRPILNEWKRLGASFWCRCGTAVTIASNMVFFKTEGHTEI